MEGEQQLQAPGPPLVVRAENAVELHAQIRRAEGRTTSFKNPGSAPADTGALHASVDSGSAGGSKHSAYRAKIRLADGPPGQ